LGTYDTPYCSFSLSIYLTHAYTHAYTHATTTLITNSVLNAQARQAEQLRQQQLQRQQEALLRKQQEEAAALRQQQEAAAAAAAAKQEALQKQQQQQAQQVAAQQEALRKQQQRQQQQQQRQQQQQQASAALQQQQQQQEKAAEASKLSGIGAAPGANNAAALNAAVGLEGLVSSLGGLGLGINPTATQGMVGATGKGQAPGGASNYADTAAAAAAAVTQSSSYLKALNESFATMPTGSDSERGRHYTPQNPYATHSSYPAAPSSIFENPAVFEKLGTDCLFFIFYYAQGTYQQYLAARELKKQSWRFHKKYMTWFQRHEEPNVTTDEYEQGTYVYFDYETGWCTRIKQDFRFEYSYLEDQLQ